MSKKQQIWKIINKYEYKKKTMKSNVIYIKIKK